MKHLIKTALIASILAIIFLVILIQDDQEVLIESAESKAPSNGPVYNQIKWFSSKDKDVWMMNQSHYGLNAPKKEWERLAIVIDKTTSPKTAKYFQLGSGKLEWQEGLAKQSYRVSCYMCHSNGPRVIRPNYASSLRKVSLWDKAKITYWNLRIKFYGRVIPHPDHKREDANLEVPFRWRSSFENQVLNVKSCTSCHKDFGFLARGTLKRQHILTIKFMLREGHMPPFGFSISESDKKLINQFIGGL
ncbi:MAG: hypothetical protein CL678_15055 [Bdellovibrionaceae bacterium]|nr:hypothetical protein [Pseudobdellovibrionaceae bacterium]|tara:strand:+ start:11789 stop:12529 length:741 start_codon:yes stop_codon:yes gene_type:complete